MNQKTSKSILMRVAHALAKSTQEGSYRERLSEALKLSWYVLKRPLPDDLFVSGNAKLEEALAITQHEVVDVAADAPIEEVSVPTSAPKFKTKAARLLALFLGQSIEETVTVAKTGVHYRVQGGFCHNGTSRKSSWYKFMKQLRAHLGIKWGTMDMKRSELIALLPKPLAGEHWFDLI